MRRLQYLFLLIGLSVNAQTSDPLCGTEATAEQIEFMNSLIHKGSLSNSSRSIANTSNIVNVPLKFFLIRQSNNTGGLPESRISSLIDEVNNIYSPAGMVFFQVEDPTIIASDNFYNLDSSEENELAASRDLSGVINIYVSENLTSGGSALCGYTRFPPSTDRVFLAADCADNEFGTTAHELGHYFTLYHTHGKTNTGTTDELVDGSNCTTAGDDICDTPADPNLSGLVSGCSYTGSLKDINGAFFAPNPRNIMSYAPNGCRDFFSTGQFERIRSGLESGRDYLNLVYDNFTAKFSSDLRVGCAPFTIEFTDLTSNAASRNWNFPGSDKENSPLKTVFVTYDEPGFYTVSLTVTNAEGQESEVTRENYILVEDPFENLLQAPSENSFLTSDLPEKWEVDNKDQSVTWAYDASSSDAAGGSYFIDNYNYGAELTPQFDDLNLSSFDLRDIKLLTIEFSYAYTHRFEEGENLAAYDSIAVGFKLDCDKDITELFRSGGNELMTTSSAQNDFFVPSENDWSNIEVTLDISSISRVDDHSTLTPIIRNETGNGNNFYLDNLVLTPDFSLDSVEFFRVRIDDGNVTLRWANSAFNSRSVIIERSIDDADFVVIDEIDASITEYIDSSIQQEDIQTVQYRVKNVNNIEESSYSVIDGLDLLSTGISNEEIIVIYPNPAKNQVKLNVADQLLSKITSIEIIGLNGKAIHKIDDFSNQVVIDISSLKNGIFFVKINSDTTPIYKKLIKTN